MIHDILLCAALLFGGFFCLTAGLGVMRLPDVMTRQHASAKAGTLGVGLLLSAVSLYFGHLEIVSLCFLALLFIMITAPVASHLIGRSAYRSGILFSKNTVIDELETYNQQKEKKKKSLQRVHQHMRF
jgi:multicomponent Na+:H+ antiporter subunit G